MDWDVPYTKRRSRSAACQTSRFFEPGLNDDAAVRYRTCIEMLLYQGMVMAPQAAYEELIHHYREARLLDSVGSLIGWDERTYMPSKGSAHRA